jgi:asparagine synthase (glutamine-hydrolysing)
MFAPARKLMRLMDAPRRRQLDLMLTPRPSLERHLAWISVFGERDGEVLLEPTIAGELHNEAANHLHRVAEEWSDQPPVEQAMYVDFKTWLVDDILTKADRMTMAASIEARAPFLDQRVIEFSFSLPVNERLAGRETKGLLREALRDVLPPSVLGRPKRAFQVPVQRWLSTRFAASLEELLLSPDAATRTLLRRAEVGRLLDERGREASRKLWTIAVLELWLRTVLAAPRSAQMPQVASA